MAFASSIRPSKKRRPFVTVNEDELDPMRRSHQVVVEDDTTSNVGAGKGLACDNIWWRKKNGNGKTRSQPPARVFRVIELLAPTTMSALTDLLFIPKWKRHLSRKVVVSVWGVVYVAACQDPDQIPPSFDVGLRVGCK